MDQLFFKKIALQTTLGCLAWERERRQTVLLNLSLGMDNKAGTSDNLTDTVNYAELIAAIRAYAAEHQFNLIEALAEGIAATVLRAEKILEVSVEVMKLGILPDVAEVGFRITRYREKESHAADI